MCSFSELPCDLDKPFSLRLLFPWLQAPSAFSFPCPFSSFLQAPRGPLGFTTPELTSLYVFSPARAQMSHVSTRSPLPWQSALHWAFLSPFLSPGRSQEQRHLGPSRQGFGSSEAGQLGTGQGVQGQTSCYILSQEPQFRGFFHNHASLGSCRSPGCRGF